MYLPKNFEAYCLVLQSIGYLVDDIEAAEKKHIEVVQELCSLLQWVDNYALAAMKWQVLIQSSFKESGMVQWLRVDTRD